MSTHKVILKLALLLLPTTAEAQQEKGLPYDLKLVMEESETGDCDFEPSLRVRGIRGFDDIVIWSTEDKQSLIAFKGSHILWKTDVTSACPLIVGAHEIKYVASQSRFDIISLIVGP